jgi:hypothetical protein
MDKDNLGKLVNVGDLADELQALKAENERLKDELGNWRYELAYCSMEEMPTDDEAVIPTPKGVKKFIDELLEEKTRLKHILTARHIKFSPNPVSVEELKKIIKLTEQVNPDKTGLSCDHYPKFCECRFAEINKLAQALFDRIYGKGEVKIDEIAKLKQALKREHMWVLHYKKLWEDTFIDKDPELKDKPKEYCPVEMVKFDEDYLKPIT